MKTLLRMLVTLTVAAILVLAGFAVLAHGRPTLGTVHDTEVRGPSITFDGTPQLERAPQFRIRVGDSQKTAQWVQVNLVQYATCSAGDRWNGTVCSKLDLPDRLSGTTVAAFLVLLAMIAVPVVGLRSGSQP